MCVGAWPPPKRSQAQSHTLIQLIFSQQLNANYGSLTNYPVHLTDHNHYGLLQQAKQPQLLTLLTNYSLVDKNLHVNLQLNHTDCTLQVSKHRARTSQAIYYSWTKQTGGCKATAGLRLYYQRPYQQLSIKQQFSSLATTTSTTDQLRLTLTVKVFFFF